MWKDKTQTSIMVDKSCSHGSTNRQDGLYHLELIYSAINRVSIGEIKSKTTVDWRVAVDRVIPNQIKRNTKLRNTTGACNAKLT